MKISNSKKELARIISENGGWRDGEAIFAAMDGNGDLFGYSGRPQWTVSHGHWYGHTLTCWFFSPIVINNHHQTILSREEYYHAYPKADADGWIEWKGGDTPVNHHVIVDVKYLNGTNEFGFKAGGYDWDWGSGGGLTIVAYRLHKPEVKPEFCESVMRSIPEPESHEKLSPEAIEDAKFALMSESIEESKRKPTIEQLAQDYRNAKDYADRLQKEAGEAAVKAEEFAVEIRKKILELQELIGISKPESEPELVITNWRDLRVDDVIWYGGDDELSPGEYHVMEIETPDYEGYRTVLVNGDGGGHWIDTRAGWGFIRRA